MIQTFPNNGIVKLGDINLSYLEFGQAEESNPTVLYIHGWLDNAASFSQIMSEIHLSNPEMHQVAFDLVGHGYSGHRGNDNFYAFHDYIDDLHQLIEYLALKRCILVGHSLGGLIASCYSAAFPEKVVGLIQIDGIGPLGEESLNAVKRLRDGVISRDRVRKKTRKGYSSFELALKHKAKTTGLSEEQVRPLVERGISLDPDSSTWRWKAASQLSAQALYRMSREQVDVYLSHIHVRFDIIAAERGLIAARLDLQRYRPEHANVHTLAGGHHCHIEQPKPVLDLIIDHWLEQKLD